MDGPKQDIVQWLKTTTWFKSQKATVPVPPDVLRDLIAEIDGLRTLARLISGWVPVSRPEWGEKSWAEKLAEMEKEAGVKLNP